MANLDAGGGTTPDDTATDDSNDTGGDSGTDSSSRYNRRLRDRLRSVLREKANAIGGGSTADDQQAEQTRDSGQDTTRDRDTRGRFDRVRQAVQERSREFATRKRDSPSRVEQKAQQIQNETPTGGQQPTTNQGLSITNDPTPFSGPTNSGQYNPVDAGTRTAFDDVDKQPEPSNPFDRGSRASEAARDVADFLVDATFQGEQTEAVARSIGLEGDRAEQDDVVITGPAVDFEAGAKNLFLQQGEQRTLDTDLTDQLTAPRGFLSEEQERDLLEDMQQRSEAFDFSDEAFDVVQKQTGSDTAANVAAGLGTIPAFAVTAPAGLTKALDTASEAAVAFPDVARERGVVDATTDTLGAGFEVTARGVESTTEAAQENPARFAGAAVGQIVLGTAALKGVRAGAQRGRNLRVRLDSDDTIDFEDITDERGVRGENPTFDTSPSAPTSEAVEEVIRRSERAPDELKRATDTNRVLFRSESERLPESIDVGEGRYELPGLFTSPDASPLRLDFGRERSVSDLIPRLPRASDFTGRTQRLSAFEGDRIEGAPSRAAGSGRLFDVEEGRPDPSTAGYQFFTEDATPGTAYVRPTGDRTPELETVFPPDTEFTKTGQLAVNLPEGDVGTLDVFRRIDDDANTRTTVPDLADADDAADRVFTVGEIERRSTRADAPSGTPVTPPVFGSGSTAPTGGDATGTTSGSGSPADTVFGGGTTGPGGSSRGGGTSTGPFTLPPSSSPPTGSESNPIFSPPTSPPTGGSGSPSTSPPTSPPTGPPSTGTGSPPSGGPGSPGGGSSGGVPGLPSDGGPTAPRNLFAPRRSNDDDEDRLREFRVDDEVFDTGVVQSLDELNARTDSAVGNPLAGLDDDLTGR